MIFLIQKKISKIPKRTQPLNRFKRISLNNVIDFSSKDKKEEN